MRDLGNTQGEAGGNRPNSGTVPRTLATLDAEITRLRAEVERLKRDVAELQGDCQRAVEAKMAYERERDKALAEIERLTTAKRTLEGLVVASNRQTKEARAQVAVLLETATKFCEALVRLPDPILPKEVKAEYEALVDAVVGVPTEARALLDRLQKGNEALVSLGGVIEALADEQKHVDLAVDFGLQVRRLRDRLQRAEAALKEIAAMRWTLSGKRGQKNEATFVAEEALAAWEEGKA